MRTTVDIPDRLLLRAKKRALELHCPLRELIEKGLREQIRPQRASRNPPEQRKKRVHWVTVPGGIPEGLDLSDRVRMHEWLSRET